MGPDEFDVDSLLPDEGPIKSEVPENQVKKTRQKLKPWLMEQINSGAYPGLEWINQEEQIFKIPWKHFGRPGDFDIKSAMLFRAWAVHTKRYDPAKPEDVSRWKTNLRCALDRQPEIKRVNEIDLMVKDKDSPFRAYQFISPDKNVASPLNLPSNSTSTCNSPASIQDYKTVCNETNLSYPIDDLSYDDFDLQDFLDETNLNSMPGNLHNLHLIQHPVGEKHLVVKFFHGETEVCRRIVDNPKGLRIAFEPPPILDEKIIEEKVSQLRSIYGPFDAEQLYFPPNSDEMAMKILENMPRGLFLQESNGSILATRLCRARVFYSDSIAPIGGAMQLQRENTVSVFDYIYDFVPKLKLFMQGVGPIPTAEIYFSFGQTWSQDRPLKNNYIYVSITHQLAHRHLSEVLNSRHEILASDPNPYDLLAQHLAELSVQQKQSY